MQSSSLLPTPTSAAASSSTSPASARQRPLPRGLRAGLWLTGLVMALLVDVTDARGRSRSRHARSDDSIGPMKITLLIFVLLCTVCGGGILWCLYLEYRPEPEQVRFGMLFVLAITTIAEFALCASATLKWWMWPVIFLTNIWGFLDAVLRFPVVHDFDTAFSCKQVLLLVVKVGAGLFGFIDFRQNWVWFFLMILVDICTLPLMYFLALPLDEDPKEQRMAASCVEDVDLAVRVVRLITNKEARKECILGCRRRSHKATLDFARTSTLTSRMLKGVSQSYERELRVRSV